MFVIKNYITTGGTVICALAIGYLMQNGPNARDNAARNAAAMDQATVVAGLADIVLTSSSPSETASFAPDVPARADIEPASTATPQKNCSISARAMPAPGANAVLKVKAPCYAEERVEIHHSGLTISQRTDGNGSLTVKMPALSEYAIFLISMDDNKGTVATTHIPDIDRFDRIALQWQGETGLQIHALEFGASYGQSGHVSSDASTQGEGTVVRLGQQGLPDAQNIEVYSFPAGRTQQTGSVALTVEAEVTQANCGRDLNVQSLELRADRRLRSRDLIVTMPMCSEIGEFLVLNNLFQDLKIAAK